MTRLLRKIEEGRGEPSDLETLQQVATSIVQMASATKTISRDTDSFASAVSETAAAFGMPDELIGDRQSNETGTKHHYPHGEILQ